MTTMQPGHTIQVLDHGFVRYIDHMGSDTRIVEAARVSYGQASKGPEADKKLLGYLWRNRHTSPFEMAKVTLNIKMPIFVMRQYVRHRMQCLAGSTNLIFDLPGGQRRGRRIYKLSIADVYSRWSNKRKQNAIRKMRLRSINEDTLAIETTHITDCMQSGIKEVFELVLENGVSVQMSKDHRIFTKHHGWMTLEQIRSSMTGDVRVASCLPIHRRAPRWHEVFTDMDFRDEQWRSIDGYCGYEVSNLGRVRAWRNTRGSWLQEPRIKKVTQTPTGHLVVSLSKHGVSATRLVHRLVLESFVGPRDLEMECGHRDGNGFNNRLTNLRWIARAENQAEKTAMGSVPALGVDFSPVAKILNRGQVMTYDIEVSGRFRNFCADGMVVHNSMNEVSARYTKLPGDFYIPAQWRKQDLINRQSSIVEPAWRPVIATAPNETCSLSEALRIHCEASYELYETMIRIGVAREQARMVLPVNIYTECYACWDLKNLLHFITLREDAHAQAEIQEYGRAIRVILTELFPWTMEHYDAYKFQIIEPNQDPAQGPSNK